MPTFQYTTEDFVIDLRNVTNPSAEGKTVVGVITIPFSILILAERALAFAMGGSKGEECLQL